MLIEHDLSSRMTEVSYMIQQIHIDVENVSSTFIVVQLSKFEAFRIYIFR